MASGVADRDPGALVGERPDADPGARAARRRSPGCPSPSRSQTKLASVGGTVQPWASSSSRTRARSFTARSTRLEQLGLGGQRRDRRRLGERVHGERQHRLAHGRRRPARARPGSRPAARPARRPWRTCAAPRRSGGRGTGSSPSGTPGSRTYSRVGLVQHHQAVRRHPVEELLKLGAVHDGAGRVVRVADEDHPGPRGDRVRHRGQVVRLVPQRHPHDRSPRSASDQRAGTPRTTATRTAPRSPGSAAAAEQLLGHPHRAAAHRDVRGRDAVAGAAIASVSAGAPLSGYRLTSAAASAMASSHRGQRPERGLVGRQLERPAVRGCATRRPGL